jgi:hypothetical protein
MKIFKRFVKKILKKFNYDIVRIQPSSVCQETVVNQGNIQEGNSPSLLNSKEANISYKHIKCDVRELFFQQQRGNKFNRYDIVVRYLAIENYYKINDFGFNLYNKMQINRVGEIKWGGI